MRRATIVTKRTMGRWSRRWQPGGLDKLEIFRYRTRCGRAVFRWTCGASTKSGERSWEAWGRRTEWVREMLDALVRDGALSKRTNVKEARGKAEVWRKSSEKMCVHPKLREAKCLRQP